MKTRKETAALRPVGGRHYRRRVQSETTAPRCVVIKREPVRLWCRKTDVPSLQHPGPTTPINGPLGCCTAVLGGS